MFEGKKSEIEEAGAEKNELIKKLDPGSFVDQLIKEFVFSDIQRSLEADLEPIRKMMTNRMLELEISVPAALTPLESDLRKYLGIGFEDLEAWPSVECVFREIEVCAALESSFSIAGNTHLRGGSASRM